MFALQVLHKIASVECLRILSATGNRLRTGLANGISRIFPDRVERPNRRLLNACHDPLQSQLRIVGTN